MCTQQELIGSSYSSIWNNFVICPVESELKQNKKRAEESKPAHRNNKALYLQQTGFVIQWPLLLWCLLLYLDEQFGPGCLCSCCSEDLARCMPCTVQSERETCERTSTQGQLAGNSGTSFSLKATHQESVGPASLYLAECR